MPDDSSSLPLARSGWRRETLQVLRWLMHDRAALTQGVLALLEHALHSEDWELRVTGLLAAARLGAASLRPRLAHLRLPEARRQGVTDTEHRLLLALRDAALQRLGLPLERSLPLGVAQAIAGDLSALPPGLAAFAHALCEPLPEDWPEPPPAAALRITEQGPELADGHLLVWVPPIEHLLGDDSLREGVPNPSRRATPRQGFYIDAQRRGRGTLAQAETAALVLKRTLGRPVALPTAEQWEMAARGPDGRRYPWGMNAESEVRTDVSPWGMSDIVAAEAEWLRREQWKPLGCAAGGARSAIVAHQWHEDGGRVHGYRFVYESAS